MADYTARVEEFTRIINKTITQGAVKDVELARRLESAARRIRRNAEKSRPASQPLASTKGKYGRLCNANRKQYRQDVNFYYWQTNLSVAAIARHLGISQTSVAKLIGRKPDD